MSPYSSIYFVVCLQFIFCNVYNTFNIKSLYSKVPAAKERMKVDPTPRVSNNYAPSLPYFVSGVERAEIRNVDMT